MIPKQEGVQKTGGNLPSLSKQDKGIGPSSSQSNGTQPIPGQKKARPPLPNRSKSKPDGINKPRVIMAVVLLSIAGAAIAAVAYYIIPVTGPYPPSSHPTAEISFFSVDENHTGLVFMSFSEDVAWDKIKVQVTFDGSGSFYVPNGGCSAYTGGAGLAMVVNTITGGGCDASIKGGDMIIISTLTTGKNYRFWILHLPTGGVMAEKHYIGP